MDVELSEAIPIKEDFVKFCAKGKLNFYKKLGFVERELDAPGMSLLL